MDFAGPLTFTSQSYVWLIQSYLFMAQSHGRSWSISDQQIFFGLALV